jgi:hypothetical protein
VIPIMANTDGVPGGTASSEAALDMALFTPTHVRR